MSSFLLENGDRLLQEQADALLLEIRDVALVLVSLLRRRQHLINR